MKKRKLFLLPLISAMFLMVGCGETPDDPKKDDPTEEPGKEDPKEDPVDPTPVVEYWSVSFTQGNYENLKLFSDDARSKEITDNKVEKGKALVFEFTLKDAANEELDSVTYGAVTDTQFQAATKVSDTNGTYVYKIAEVKADTTVAITTKAKQVTPPEPTVDGFEVTFELKAHVSALKVYKTEARAAADVDNGSKFYSRDAATGDATKSDGQINFEFKLDAGYQLKSITATSGTYKNIKFLGIKNGVVLAKVTKITADTKVTIEAEENTVAHDGNAVTFVKGDHVTLKIYENCGFTDGTEITGLVTKSIEQETGNGTKSKGRAYFIATFDEGYELDSIAITPEDSGAELDVDDPEGSHVIKKISKDITVTVTAKATAGGGGGTDPVDPPAEAHGFEVSFSKVNIDGSSWNGQSHISAINVYTTQKMDTIDEGTTTGSSWSQKTVYETREGKTDAKLNDGNGQINFSVVPEEGYQVKSITATAGTYKNIKFVGAGEGLATNWRITKITANTTVTVELEAETAGWPVAINGAAVEVYIDETFTTPIPDAQLVSMDAAGQATKDNGSLYFKVSAPHGYTLGADAPVLNIDGAGSLKAVKGMDNCYKLTGIACRCSVTFSSSRDAVNVPYLYFKSTTKANSYVNGSNIAQSGDTYFVIGPDAEHCIAMWFWTYNGEESKEEINIVIELTFDGANVNAIGDPTAQYNGSNTDRKEWQHCSTRSFAVEEIASTDIPTDFVHYVGLLASNQGAVI